MGAWGGFRTRARTSAETCNRRAGDFSPRRKRTSKRFSPVSFGSPRTEVRGSPGARRLAACDFREELPHRSTTSADSFNVQTVRFRSGEKHPMHAGLLSNRRRETRGCNPGVFIGIDTRPPGRTMSNRAGVAELADAPDSKSGGAHPPCGFDSHLRHWGDLEPSKRSFNPDGKLAQEAF